MPVVDRHRDRGISFGRGRRRCSSERLCTFRRQNDASRTRSDGDASASRPSGLEAVPARRVPAAYGRSASRSPTPPDCSSRRGAQAQDAELWALRTSPSRSSRARRWGSSAGTAPARARCSRSSRASRRRRGARRDPGRVGSLLEVGTGLPPGAHRPREHLPQRRHPGHDAARDRAQVRRDRRVLRGRAFLDTPVKRYSSGMYVRLAFSVAAHLEPEILLVDEVLAVGDAEFQARRPAGRGASARPGRTVVFVSHNMQTVAQLCDRVILMERGWIAMDGPSADVVAHYLQTSAGAGSSRTWPDLETAPATTLRATPGRCASSTGTVRPSTTSTCATRSGSRSASASCGRAPAVVPKIKLVSEGRSRVQCDGRRSPLERARPVRASTSRPPGFPATSSTRG